MGGGGQQNVKGKLSIHLFELLLGGTILEGGECWSKNL